MGLWYLLFPCSSVSLCLWRCGRHVDANLLVFSWHRMTPAWRDIRPLTLPCHEIIEPRSVPDCMLSSCSPDLFHSLIRGFECRKGLTKQSQVGWRPCSCCHAMSHGICIVRVLYLCSISSPKHQIITTLCTANNKSKLLDVWSCIVAQTCNLDYFWQSAFFVIFFFMCDSSFSHC